MDDYIGKSNMSFLMFIIHTQTRFTKLLSYQVNPSRSLVLIIIEPAWRVYALWNLEFLRMV